MLKRDTIYVVNGGEECLSLLRALPIEQYRIAATSESDLFLPDACAGTQAALILLDISDGADGCDTITSIRGSKALEGTPIIAYTREPKSAADERLIKSGARDVLTPDTSSGAAFARIARALEDGAVAPLNVYLKDEMLRMAETDYKTGLNNRQTFCRKAAQLLKDNPDTRYIIVRWDIDRFKVYNDIFGVSEGDRLLRTIGDSCSQYEWALCTHLDADHFACCMPLQMLNESQLIANATKHLLLYNPNYELIIRFGVYEVEDPSLDVNLMCDRALMALRSIKGSYTRHLAWYDNAMRNELLREQEIIGQMDVALENGQFQVYLQPQFDYSKGDMIGAEALVRWVHPQRGVISPGDFIPLFERNGFISRMDEYVWEQTCALIRRWIDLGLNPVPISVNISRQDTYNPSLCDTLTALIKKYGLDSSLLRLEITETAYVEDPELVISVVKRLQACGFYVEMDDFGAGYSSLNSLKDIPVNMLKLDMRFINAGSSSDRSGIILTSVVRMAMWLGVSVLAEGVETARQADYLKTIGCDLVQGYLYARPMPADSFERLLTEKALGNVSGYYVPASFFNSHEFWDPEAQATVIFNSFVGAACIFEYCAGNADVMRGNDRYFNMIGKNRSDHLQSLSHMQLLIFDEDRALVLAAVERAIATDEETECEARWHNRAYPDGCMWLRTRLRAIAHGGDRHALYAALEDITERKRITRELDERRISLQLLYDTIPCGILQFASDGDDNFTLYSFNDEVLRLFGYPSHQAAMVQLDTTAYRQHIHPDDMQLVISAIARVKIETSREDFDARIIRPDGTLRWVHALLQRVPTANGMLLQCVCTDITQKKEAELDLYGRSMFAIYDQVYLIDSEKRITELRYTRGMTEETGLSIPIDDYMRRWMDAHVDSDSRKALLSLFSYLGHMARDEVRSVEYCFTSDSGSIEWVSSVMICAGGTNYLLCSKLITVQHEAERLAAENAALRATMLAHNAEDERNRLFMEHSGVLVVDYVPATDEMTFRRRLPDGSVDIQRYSSPIQAFGLCGKIHPEYIGRMKSVLERAKSHPTHMSVECLARREDEPYRFYRVDFVSVGDENGEVYRIVGIITDIQDAKDDMDISSALIGRLGVSDLRAAQRETLAEQVFRLLYETEDLSESIQAVLEVFGRKVGASRTYIVEDDGDGVHCTNTFEWCEAGVPSIVKASRRHEYPTGTRESYLKLFREDMIFACDDINKLDAKPRAMYAGFGIKALAQFAIIRGGRFFATVGFDNCESPQRWSKVQLDQLSMVAKRVGVFLDCRRNAQY